ncbi:MAG TPA: RusA family crossover junction endodeoxyribonuclease [Nitrospiraceae bacterium]|nr:RusA family crossover junction endodeoxyribonuclease [Nitrospiraceae bacterium]
MAPRSGVPAAPPVGTPRTRRAISLALLGRAGAAPHLAALPELCAAITPQSLTLSLPVPPSINHQYATVNGRRILSSEGRGYKATVGQQVLIALARSPHKESLLRVLRSSDLTLAIHFYFASPLRRDVDGGLKIAQDALCEALRLNDNRIVEIHLYKSRDAHHPRIEMTLGTCP